MKLNLGCGNNIMPGFTNVDAIPLSKGVIKADIIHFKPEGIVEEVVLSHVIEHLTREEALQLLKNIKEEYHTTEDFKIKITVPIIDGGLDWEKKGKLAPGFFQQIIYGERTNEYEYHKYAYTKESIMQLVIDAGLKIKTVTDLGWQYEIIGTKQ